MAPKPSVSDNRRYCGAITRQPERANCPASDEHSKWLLRLASSASFDRWGVSAAISERFDNTVQVTEFLSNTSAVYKMVLQRLSEDYKELEDRYMDAEYGEWDK